MKIGIFGITGNPPHLGHAKVILSALDNVEQVWVTPVYNHAFDKKFIDYNARVDMISLLLEEMGSYNVVLKELDKEYYEYCHEIVYSYNLLSYLKNKYPEHQFKLIIGEDNYKKEVWSKFFKYQELEDEFGLVIIKDSGFHSTQLRHLLENNEPISEFVGNKVEEYIKKNELYQIKEGKKWKA